MADLVGKSNRRVEVNSANELNVRAMTETALERASREGRAFTWDSTEQDIDAGDTMLFVKNTSTTPLRLSRAEINGSNVICTWTVGIGSATTTPAGTTVAAVNMNETFSSKAFGHTALHDETAVATANTSLRVKTPVTNTVHLDLSGYVLNEGQYIQITQVTESTSGSVCLVGYFDTVED